MKKIFKNRYLTLFLIFSLVWGLLAGCGGATQNSTQETSEVPIAEETESVAEVIGDVTEELAEESAVADVTTESETADAESEVTTSGNEAAEEKTDNSTAENVETEVIPEETSQEVPESEQATDVTEKTATAEENTEESAEEKIEEPVTVPETESIAQTASISIKPSDFKLFGYSINKNHYQEWKTVLGYNGDESVGEVVRDTPYGAYIICDNGNFVDIGHSIEGDHFLPYISWMNLSAVDGSNSSYTHQFYVVKYAERMDVIRSHFTGPVTIDMSKDEVKQLLGCAGGESVLADGSKVSVDSMDGSWMNEMINVYGSNYQIMIGIKDNSVGYIGVMFNL